MEWTLAESLALADRLARTFESLGVPYAVGGSVASSVHGFPRSTMDVDLVAALRESHVSSFVAHLGDDFYYSEEAIRDAIARRDCFNVIELRTMLKADVFVARDDAHGELRRAREIETEDGHRFAVVTAEDIVAEKLRWFRLGGETSQRQWQDLLGVIEVQGGALDRAALRARCASMGVEDLLDRALAESGTP